MIKKVLISEEEIKNTVKKMGEEITNFYNASDKELVVVGLLKGSFIFMADLVRQIDLPLTTDFMIASSYGANTESSGSVRIKKDLDFSIEGKDVVLVEDIIDTGRTFSTVLKMLKNRNPNSLKVCTLLNKPSRREIEVPIDFCGIEIPDEFVCGYGLDFDEKYRNLPYIGVLEI